MPLIFLPSAEQLETRQKNTARKRLRNQNSEIDELAALLPIKQPSTLGNGVVARGRNQSIDKISVLRLTSAYLKFQKYMEKDQQKGREVFKKPEATPTTNLFSEALSGFLLVLDSEGTILYASDSITNMVGLTQYDVIGQNLADITDEDDLLTITKNLQSSTTPPSTHLDGRKELQHRQFFVRIKSSLTPGQIQLSRFKFKSHIMIQISGNLKVHIPFQSHLEPKQEGLGSEPQVLGFVGECHPIESTPSILEVWVTQSHFTSTLSLDKEVISVEASVKGVVGYDPADFVGTNILNYIHPGDQKKVFSHAKNMLMPIHRKVTPAFRFLSGNGEWVWMQVEGMLRYKEDGVEPQFWEVKAKLVSDRDEHTSTMYVEYLEKSVRRWDTNQTILHPHKELMDTENRCCQVEEVEPIKDLLKDAQDSSSLIDPVPHSQGEGLTAPPADCPRGFVYTEGYSGDTSTALASDTTLQQNGYLDQGPVQADVLSISNVRDSLSPVGSGLDGYSLSNLHTISPSHLHTLTPSHSLDTPPDSVVSIDYHTSDPSPTKTSAVTTPPVATDTFRSTEFSNHLLPLIDQPYPTAQAYLNRFDLNPFAQNISSDVPFSPPTVSSDIIFSSSPNSLDPSLQLSTLNTPTQNSPYSSQNGFRGTTLPTHPLNKTTSLSSLASSVASPQNFSDCSSPQSSQGTTLTLSQGTTLTPLYGTLLTRNHLPDTECLDHILSVSDNAPISPEQVFLTTDNNSLERILGDMISLNQGGGGVGSGWISVKCKAHSSEGVGGYQDGGFSVGNTDADEVIQQFLS